MGGVKQDDDNVVHTGKEWDDAEWNGAKRDDDDAGDPGPGPEHDPAEHAGPPAAAGHVPDHEPQRAALDARRPRTRHAAL